VRRLWVVSKRETFFDAFEAKIIVAKPAEHMGFVVGVLGIRHSELNDMVFDIRDFLLHGREIGADQAELFKRNVIGIGH
jgi:hypothetical protein